MWGKMCGHGVKCADRPYMAYNMAYNMDVWMEYPMWGKMCGHGVKCADRPYMAYNMDVWMEYPMWGKMCGQTLFGL